MTKKFDAEARIVDERIVRRQYAHRNAEIRSDVIVPVLQSIVGPIAILIALVLLEADTRIAIGVSIVVFVTIWTILLVDHRRALWMLEEFTDLDIDQDGSIGEPETTEPQTTRIEFVNRGQDGNSISWDTFSIPPSDLHKVAGLMIHGSATFSRDGLSSVLTQTAYNRLASEMEDRGLVVKMSNNRRSLTRKGIAMMRVLADADPPTRPTQ